MLDLGFILRNYVFVVCFLWCVCVEAQFYLDEIDDIFDMQPSTSDSSPSIREKARQECRDEYRWRYEEAERHKKELKCFACVNDYELPFPPKESDIVKMATECLRPTNEELVMNECERRYRYSLVMTSADVQKAKKRTDKCLQCVKSKKIPPGRNVSLHVLGRVKFECAPPENIKEHLAEPCLMLSFVSLDHHLNRPMVCQRCINESSLHSRSTYNDVLTVKRRCYPRINIREALLRNCKDMLHFRFPKTEDARDKTGELRECQKCVNSSVLVNWTMSMEQLDDPLFEHNSELEKAMEIAQRCAGFYKDISNDIIHSICEEEYDHKSSDVERCMDCAKKMNVSLEYIFSYRSSMFKPSNSKRNLQKCLPQRSILDKAKRMCRQAMSSKEEIDKCLNCVSHDSREDHGASDRNAKNSISVDNVAATFAHCYKTDKNSAKSGSRQYNKASKIFEGCLKITDNPDQQVLCQRCVSKHKTIFSDTEVKGVKDECYKTNFDANGGNDL